MKAGTESKAKFKMLQRRLRLNLWQCTGLLESLWQIVARDAPQGDIGRLSNEVIAATIEWEGDEDELVESLVACGWLDEDDHYRLVVHDWQDHCPNYVKGNLARHNKDFVSANGQDVAKQPPREDVAKQPPEPEPATCLATSSEDAATKPSQAKPNQVKSREERAVPSKAPKKGAALPRFQKPTTEEVRAYCKARGSPIDAQQFWDFYEAKGWRVGNQPMKCWQACVRTWESRTRKEEAQKPSGRRGDAMTAEECLEAEVRSVLAKRGVRDEAEIQRWLARARKERGL